MFVEVVDLRLEMIDVMASFEYDFRTESQLREAIDDPRQQHHASLGGNRRDQIPDAATAAIDQQHDVTGGGNGYFNSITTAPLKTKKTTERL